MLTCLSTVIYAVTARDSEPMGKFTELIADAPMMCEASTFLFRTVQVTFKTITFSVIVTSASRDL
jgi:hypothetical protein